MPYPSKLKENAHEMAKGLYKFGLIDTQTMKKFDEDCLPKVKELSAEEIKELRLRENVSQPLFAHYLNTSSSTIKQWEKGLKRPSGISLKLLNLISKKGLAWINV